MVRRVAHGPPLIGDGADGQPAPYVASFLEAWIETGIERQLPWAFPGIGWKEAREIGQAVEMDFVSYHTIEQEGPWDTLATASAQQRQARCGAEDGEP